MQRIPGAAAEEASVLSSQATEAQGGDGTLSLRKEATLGARTMPEGRAGRICLSFLMS